MKRSELKQLIKECVKVILAENRSEGVPTEADEIVKTGLDEYAIFDLRKLAQDWHSGQWSPLYAFASSGYITPGLANEAMKAKKEYEANPDQHQDESENDVSDMFDAIISLEDRLPQEVDEEAEPNPMSAVNVEKVNPKLKEMSTTGGVAGYSTPFAFSKNKQGSKRAIDASKEIGYTPVKNVKQ